MFYIQKPAALCPQNQFTYTVCLPPKQPLLPPYITHRLAFLMDTYCISPEATDMSLFKVEEL